MKRDLSLKWHNVDPGSLRGRRAIVVGGTGGVGRAVSQALAARGAQVTVVGQTFRDADIANISLRTGRSQPAEGCGAGCAGTSSGTG